MLVAAVWAAQLSGAGSGGLGRGDAGDADVSDIDADAGASRGGAVRKLAVTVPWSAGAAATTRTAATVEVDVMPQLTRANVTGSSGFAGYSRNLAAMGTAFTRFAPCEEKFVEQMSTWGSFMNAIGPLGRSTVTLAWTATKNRPRKTDGRLCRTWLAVAA